MRSEYDVRYLTGDLAVALIPLLDGSRTQTELAHALSGRFSQEAVDSTLAELRNCGYLAEAQSTRANGGIEVVCTGTSPAAEMTTCALRALGLPECEQAELRIVVTDDYLDAALSFWNLEALRSEMPWMLIRPVGRLQWIGPVFRPPGGPCWQCLAARLEGNGWLAAAFSKGGFATSGAITQTMAAQEALRWLQSSGAGTDLDSCFIELDYEACTVRRHTVRTLPGCPACGGAVANTAIAMDDLISPATGIVTSLEISFQSAPFTVCSAQMSQVLRPDGGGVLLYTQRALVSGSGESVEEARLHCLGEAVERYSTQVHGDERRLRSTLSMLGPSALDPASLLLFSDRQYENGDAPPRFRADEETDWTAVRCYTSGERYYVPTSYCYYGYGLDSCGADSNGCAAGPNWDTAVSNGLLELIERDAVAIWWYNRIPRPALLLENASDRIQRLCRLLQTKLRSQFIFDLKHDLDIPVCVAVGVQSDGVIVRGSGAGIGYEVAAWRALREMAVNVLERCEETIVQPEPWLMPTDFVLHDLRREDEDDTGSVAIVERASRELGRRGLRIFLLDLTRRDIGLPVARVISPGLRPWSRRFAPGRLYDVPVQLGWLSRARGEEELSSLRFPL